MKDTINDNETDLKSFLSLADYNIKVSFSEWSNSKWPVTEVTFKNLIGPSNTHKNYNFLQAIVCEPLAPFDDVQLDGDESLIYDLVLFLEECTQDEIKSVEFSQKLYIKSLKKKGGIRFRTVLYYTHESIPSALSCKEYYDIWPADGVGVPDTNTGGVVIKP